MVGGSLNSLLLFTHKVMSNCLQLHGLQRARPPCTSPSAIVCSNSCPLSQRCYPTSSSSIIPFSCLQSFPASCSFTFFHKNQSPYSVCVLWHDLSKKNSFLSRLLDAWKQEPSHTLQAFNPAKSQGQYLLQCTAPQMYGKYCHLMLTHTLRNLACLGERLYDVW